MVNYWHYFLVNINSFPTSKSGTLTIYYAKFEQVKNILLIIFICTCCFSIQSQQISIDGHVDDWPNDLLVASDIEGGNQLDIQRLYAYFDDQYLYLRVDVSEDIILQRESDLVLAIDADLNNETGFPINGLGTEFSFYFENNNSFINPVNSSINVNHSDVGFFVAPAFESRSFEFAINRDLGGFGPTLDGQIRLTIFNDIFGGDRLPNSGGVIIDLSDFVPTNFPSPNFTKSDQTDFRIVNLNSRFDQFFENSSFEAYNRMFKSVDPDIIAFQELFDGSSGEAADRMETILPSGPGEQWFHEKTGSGTVLLSRYPIVFDEWVSGNGAFVLDANGQDVLVLNIHLPCCENDDGRDEEIDGILRFLREIMSGQGDYNLAEGSPFFLVGDFNLVGDGQQLNRLLTGNIQNNVIYGNDFEPDWFDGNLIDAAPNVVNSNLNYTWFNDSSSFTGGRLDYVLFPSSTIHEVNKYVIDTRLMSQTDLFLSGLSQEDSEEVSDHLVVVTDWSFNPITSTQNIIEDNRLSIFPNPFGDRLNIQLDNGQLISQINLRTFDGRLINSIKTINEKEYSIESSSLIPGYYIIEIITDGGFIRSYPVIK